MTSCLSKTVLSDEPIGLSSKVEAARKPGDQHSSTLSQSGTSLAVKPQKKQYSQWSAQVIPRYFVGLNDINSSVIHPGTGERSFDNYLAPIADSGYGSVYLFAGLTTPYRIADQTGFLYVHLDTGEIYRGTVASIDENTGESTSKEPFLSNGNTIEDELKNHLFIRQLFVSHSFGDEKHATLSVGRGNPVVGYSLIYNNYSPYIEGKLQSRDAWSLPVDLTILGVSPSDGFLPNSSLIASAELAVPHPNLGRFSIFAAKLWDKDSALSEGLRQAITASIRARNSPTNSILSGRVGLFNRLTIFESESEVNWLGGAYSKTWGNSNYVWLNGALSSGSATIGMDMTQFLAALQRLSRNRSLDIAEEIQLDLELSGFSIQAGGTVYLSETWSASAFALIMSGDDGLDSLAQAFTPGTQSDSYSDRFGAFLSIVPYLGHTNIFFNGGLDQGFSNREAAVGGLAGRGIMAAGISIAGPVWGKLSYQGGPTLLHALHTGPHGLGNVYGIEFDNGLSYALNDTTSIDAQVDLFRTGTFFHQQAWNTQTTVQVSFSPSGKL